jgi:hypothetical protein
MWIFAVKAMGSSGACSTAIAAAARVSAIA